MRIRAFTALRPPRETAHLVASVPYDTVDTREARALAEGNSRSFLRVVRPEIEFAGDVDIYSDAVYAKAAETFAAFQKNGFLVRDELPSVFLYSQKMGNHEQTGIVACCNIEDYENNLIRKHEKTREDKLRDRTRLVETLNAHTGPVFLTYRSDPAIDALVTEIRRQAPLIGFVAPDGVEHAVWRVADAGDLSAAFENVRCFYVADGHHRAAAAVQAGINRRKASPQHTGQEEYNWFLSVLFPSDQLRILPYNRCVKDLNGMSPDDFLAAVGRAFTVRENVQPQPQSARRVAMYLRGRWYGLSWQPDEGSDPVSSLDVTRLQDRLLGPILGISDPRTEPRIDFVGGIRGTSELVKRVDSGAAAVAFSMYPAAVDQMMVIADAGGIMPPKSTWFEPKLRSGLFVHTF